MKFAIFIRTRTFINNVCFKRIINLLVVVMPLLDSGGIAMGHVAEDFGYNGHVDPL